MKYYFVKVKSENETEQICFKDYKEALKFTKELAQDKSKEVSIVDNVYYTSEKIQ
jgi:hypothetical protein